MESIADGETAKSLLDLDLALGEYLDNVRSIPPPAATPPSPCEVDSFLSCTCSLGTKGCNVAHEMEEAKVTQKQVPVCRDCFGVGCDTCRPKP